MTNAPGPAFACPCCRVHLATAGDRFVCGNCVRHYTQTEGVWDFLPDTQDTALLSFIRDYEAVRLAEGRISDDPAYYQALPHPPPDAPRAAEWASRAKSYDLFRQHVLSPLEAEQRPLEIVDLGAGNGWLSNRLAERGHHPLAIDLTTNAYDGLGCLRHYQTPFAAARAPFDRLPLLAQSIDLAIFNAALHYSVDYAHTLAEALRVLRPGGRVVVIDTPVYHDEQSGQAMLEERRRQFSEAYGTASDSLPVEGYLTHERIERLSGELGLVWRWVWPAAGWRRGLRALRGRVRHGREVAQFPLLVAQRREDVGRQATL